MINRVLIRMKTVQLLYSYLLVEKPFSLESRPSNPTKEKRFAYSLYLDLIYLMYCLAARVVGKNKTHPLASSRFILCVEEDDAFKTLKTKYSTGGYPFTSLEGELATKVKESLLYKEFEKNAEDYNQDSFWENVFNAIILPDPTLNETVKGLPGYTLGGFERATALMEETFRNFYSSHGNIDDTLKILESSMTQARELYMRLLALPVELTKLHLEKLEQNRRRHLASTEDLNPNMKLVNNKISCLIEKNKDFADYIDRRHISWRSEDPELLDILLSAVLNSDIYRQYLEKPDSGLKEDSIFWQDVLVEIILNNSDFLEYLENKSVFWNDDLEIMTTFVIKTLKRLEKPETEGAAVLPMYKDGVDGKDASFGAELFTYVVENKENYRKYIREALEKDKWEAERLAFMDVVISLTAIAEIINYPEIPLNVSINEYIEIAKSYSSAKSGQFIHGLLACVIEKLQADGVIVK